MNTQVSTDELIHSIIVLLTEAYTGPPDPSSTWWIDNEPDSGILGVLNRVSAQQASTSVDASDASGSTIASNAEHLRWSLAQANAALRGEPYEGKWSESWNLLHLDSAGWDRLRGELRREFETLVQALQRQTELQGDYLLGVMALVPHAAFHLGLIRQMIDRVAG